MFAPILAVCLALITTGIALLALGWRGRLVDRAPYCRRCRFDLTGSVDADTDRCPECGAELSQPRAVRHGRRRRRPVVALAGLALLFCALFVIGLGAVDRLARVSPVNKPTWWLQADLRFAKPAAQDRAARELLNRRGALALSDRALRWTVGPALRRQADPNGAWDRTAWPELLRAAMDAKLLGERDLGSYRNNLTGAAILSVSKRDYRLLAGEVCRPQPPGLAVLPRLVQGETIGILAWPIEITRNGTPHKTIVQPGGHGLFLASFVRYGSRVTHAASVLVPRELPLSSLGVLPIGEHEVDIRYQVELYYEPEPPDPSRSTTSEPPLGEPIRVTTIDAHFDVNVIESPRDALRFVDTGSDVPVPRIDAEHTWGSDVPQTWAVQSSDDDEWCEIVMRLQRTDVPGDVAFAGFTISVLIDDEAIPLTVGPHESRQHVIVMQPVDGSTNSPRRHYASWGTVRRSPLGRRESIDVVLVPDPDIVARRAEAEVFWNERIVLRGVPLDWSAIDGDAAPTDD